MSVDDLDTAAFYHVLNPADSAYVHAPITRQELNFQTSASGLLAYLRMRKSRIVKDSNHRSAAFIAKGAAQAHYYAFHAVVAPAAD
jgi:hypothetical protein